MRTGIDCRTISSAWRHEHQWSSRPLPNKFNINVKPTRAAVVFPHCLQVISQILLSRLSQAYVLELLIQSCHNGLQLFIALDQQFQLTATRAGHKSNKVHAMSKFDVLMNSTHLRNMKCATCRTNLFSEKDGSFWTILYTVSSL